jgi:N-acetylglucosamine malate deacetylase 1
MSFRSRLRPVKRVAARVVEPFWRLAIAAAGFGLRQETSRWFSPGNQQVLVIAPHPDDEAIGCAGTLLRHSLSGDCVCVAIATDGRRSRALKDPNEMAAERKREASNAARLMGNERLEWIGLPEGDWQVPQLQELLRSLVGQIKPNIIYSPSRIDFHPEHFAVAHSLALALGELGAAHTDDLRVRVYQVQVPLTPLLSNLVADVSSVYPQCEAVLRAYRSQAGSVECAYRLRRYCASWHRIAGQAEEFWELPADRFIALHSDSPANWSQVFRGLRNFPLTDPLAYLAGGNERRRLRLMAAAA